jgi:hypothetical protein
VASPAGAVQTMDPDDSPGPMDLRVLRIVQESSGELHVRIALYDAWSKDILTPDGPERWFVFFDTKQGGGPEYRGRIVESGDQLVVRIHGQGSSFEAIPVEKLDAKALRFTVPGTTPMTKLGVGLFTTTRYVEQSATYLDRAPDIGYLSNG